MDERQLEQHVAEVVDRIAVTDMVSRLGVWLDQKQFDNDEANARMFTPDIALETPGGRARGIVDVVEQARRRHSDARTQHLHTNVLVALDGDKASAEANLIVTFVPKGGPPTDFHQVGTRYQFTLVRTAGEWRFTSIRDSMIWRSQLPR